jgi:ABC-type antimicrobial peptide transport system permease subunit
VVNRRTKEFGIRTAIGAKPASVLRMVLRQSALLAVFGVAAGMPLAIGLGRLLRAGFPEGDADPAHAALLALALFAVTLIAA